MSELLQTKVGEIKDSSLLALIEELEQACPVGSQDFVGLPLLLFLQQCVYPQGPGKRIPITTKYAASTPLLETKLSQLPDGALRDLCRELALLAGESLESSSGRKVYTLINKAVAKKLTVKGPGEKQRRWDSVINQRRSNRG